MHECVVLQSKELFYDYMCCAQCKHPKLISICQPRDIVVVNRKTLSSASFFVLLGAELLLSQDIGKKYSYMSRFQTCDSKTFLVLSTAQSFGSGLPKTIVVAAYISDIWCECEAHITCWKKKSAEWDRAPAASTDIRKVIAKWTD